MMVGVWLMKPGSLFLFLIISFVPIMFYLGLE
jgi:hypothetical protein